MTPSDKSDVSEGPPTYPLGQEENGPPRSCERLVAPALDCGWRPFSVPALIELRLYLSTSFYRRIYCGISCFREFLPGRFMQRGANYFLRETP